jgi:hypothetical protein
MNDPDEYPSRTRASRYDDVRDDFDDEFGRDRTPLGLARKKVIVPAVAFMVIGAIGILTIVVTVLALVWALLAGPRPPLKPLGLVVVPALQMLTAALFMVVLISGLHLRRLRRRWLALTGAYIVTSFALAGPYGLPVFPFGIWALVVLYQPDVREQFPRSPDAANPEAHR